jgi:glycosyltransferase involved in cell wall biosynthesis
MASDVLMIAEHRTATVSLLEQLLAHLQSTTSLRTRTRLLHELRATHLTSETYPFIVRSCNPSAHRLAKTLRRHGVAYGFYLDDNFWLLDPETPLGRHYAARGTRRRLDAIVRHASPVITATALLRDFVRTTLNEDAIQLDAFFDLSLIPDLPPAPRSHRITRGGFAGSTSRVGDLVDVFADVLRTLDAHDDVEFEVIGADDGALPVHHPRLRTFPHLPSYEEYVAFQRSREWDFALAPLGSSASNLYKTDNKYREYAAQGIPGVYQDSPAYDAVRDGSTGLLAGATRSWHDAMERYIADPELRARIRRDARQDVEKRCSLAVVAPQWERFFDSAPSAGQEPGRMEAITRALARQSSLSARAGLRIRQLVANALEELSERGLRSTVKRTARFVGKRVSRR